MKAAGYLLAISFVLILIWSMGAFSITKISDVGIITDLWGRELIESPKALRFLIWTDDYWPGVGGWAFDNAIWLAWVVSFVAWVKRNQDSL